MMKRPETLERSVMMSSVMPSAKYPCSGSPDMLSKGSTAMEGLSGSGSGFDSFSDLRAAGEASAVQRHTLTGLSMFLTSCSPRSSNGKSMRSRT